MKDQIIGNAPPHQKKRDSNDHIKMRGIQEEEQVCMVRFELPECKIPISIQVGLWTVVDIRDAAPGAVFKEGTGHSYSIPLGSLWLL